jgi:hypothetical protein
MSPLPSFGISPAPSNERDIDALRLGDLLDTLIAIRMDVRHHADGVAAWSGPGPQQMRELRILLDRGIALAKAVFDSIHRIEPDEALPQRSLKFPMYVHQRTDRLQASEEDRAGIGGVPRNAWISNIQILTEKNHEST